MGRGWEERQKGFGARVGKRFRAAPDEAYSRPLAGASKDREGRQNPTRSRDGTEKAGGCGKAAVSLLQWGAKEARRGNCAVTGEMCPVSR